MIAASSPSYPVLGAADAGGLPYGVALRLYAAWRPFQQADEAEARRAWQPYVRAFAEAEKAHGYDAVTTCFAAIRDAQREGRLA